jgi:hypothetical protein
MESWSITKTIIDDFKTIRTELLPPEINTEEDILKMRNHFSVHHEVYIYFYFLSKYYGFRRMDGSYEISIS